MKNRIRHYIEDTPWDEWIIENDRYMERATLIVCGFAVLYFFIVPSINWLIRGYYGY